MQINKINNEINYLVRPILPKFIKKDKVCLNCGIGHHKQSLFCCDECKKEHKESKLYA